MNVLVKIVLKFLQATVERVIRGTGANGRDEVAAQALDCRKKRSGGLMLADHHCDGICYCAEARIGKRAAGDQCRVQCSDIGKQDVLFLGKVVSQFVVELRKGALNCRQMALRVAVAIHHFLCEYGKARQFSLT